MDKQVPQIQAEFKPKKSGIFTLGSLLISSVLILYGVEYVANEKYLAGFLLISPGIFAGIASYTLGFKTSKNQDLESGQPIRIIAEDDSFQLSADPRTNQDLLLRVIAASADVMRNRKPLPEASGMVSEDGSGDASRVVEANQVVQQNNLEVENDFSRIESALSVSEKIDQSIIESAPKIPTQDISADDA